ncbi:MAG: MFS transporter [Gammaproteobacteria bacterium]|nr:MFS transporter [Gammaproteobacteria bacterium]
MNRSVAQLVFAQAMMMSVNSLMVTSAAIIGAHLADNPALASLPLAIQFVAVMATTIPASLLMRAIGRRSGFLLASLIGISGASCAALGIYLDSFLLFCCGTVGTGIYTGFGHYFRFTAIEAAPPQQKNTAMSYVLAGGIAAAVIGPNLANLSREVFAVTYLGSLLSVVVLYSLNSINFLLIKLPRPIVYDKLESPRAMSEIARQPAFMAAVASAAVGYSVMVLLMTATPLEMTHQRHGFGDVAFVIQWHVLGMFAPSFFTGHLINRYGVQRIIIGGIALMLLSISININGSSVTHFWIALMALGVGWNFMFIGGTSLLSETYRAEETAKAQAFNDFVVFTIAAISAFAAGALLHWLSWQLVNYAALPVLCIALFMQFWLWTSKRPQLSSSRL